MAEVAVLGTGRMGGAIARRIADTGHRVTVWNRTGSSARAVAEAGAKGAIGVAHHPAEAVAGRNVIISMLADGDATRAVLLDTTVLAALSPGSVVCDLGTSGIDAAPVLAEAMSQAGALFLDAPVSGSVPAVEAGTLLVMAGGDVEALTAAQGVLSAVADRVVHVGGPGAGQAMKLAVNLVVHNLNAALAESLGLAETYGITRDVAYDVLQQSVVAAPFVHYKRAAFLDASTPVAMSLDLVAKDLRLITGLARELGASVTVTDAVRQAVDEACAEGLGPADMAQFSRFERR